MVFSNGVALVGELSTQENRYDAFEACKAIM